MKMKCSVGVGRIGVLAVAALVTAMAGTVGSAETGAGDEAAV